MSIALSVVCMLGIAFGQILFRISAQRIDSRQLFTTIAFNGPLWVALAVYGVATLLWIHVLRSAPLNRVYPVFALAFLVVPVLESLLLGVPLRRQSLIGGAVIVVGVLIAVRGLDA
jgi:drug/metabolite transporter (DMT)-like permease